MEENAVCPKAMLILLLCHPQVHPLCSNAPPREVLGETIGAPGQATGSVLKVKMTAKPEQFTYVKTKCCGLHLAMCPHI